MITLSPRTIVTKNQHFICGRESVTVGYGTIVSVPYVLVDIHDQYGYKASIKLYDFASASYPVPQRVQERMMSQGRVVGANTAQYERYSRLYTTWRLFRVRMAYMEITAVVSTQYPSTDNLAA